MKHFLMVFDRVKGRRLRTEEFSDRTSALRARFDLEREYAPSDGVEIVVLGAQSEDALRHTHSRYFQSVGELARAGVSRMDAD